MPSTVESIEVLDDLIPDFARAPELVGQGLVDRANLLGWQEDVAAFPWKYPRHVLRHGYKLDTHGIESNTHLHDLIAFYHHSAAGRHKGFWVPSFFEELSPAGNASGTSLDIKEVEYDATYLQATSEVGRLGNYIFVLDRDGTIDYRKVTAATTGDPEH